MPMGGAGLIKKKNHKLSRTGRLGKTGEETKTAAIAENLLPT